MESHLYLSDAEVMKHDDNQSLADHMADRYTVIESGPHGVAVEEVHMSPTAWEHMKKKMFRQGVLDVNVVRQIVQTGLVGHLWTAAIHISQHCPDGCLYVFDDEIVSKA